MGVSLRPWLYKGSTTLSCAWDCQPATARRRSGPRETRGVREPQEHATRSNTSRRDRATCTFPCALLLWRRGRRWLVSRTRDERDGSSDFRGSRRARELLAVGAASSLYVAAAVVSLGAHLRKEYHQSGIVDGHRSTMRMRFRCRHCGGSYRSEIVLSVVERSALVFSLLSLFMHLAS